MTIQDALGLKTVVVLGATGTQGGSVVRALSTAGGWHLKAISRNPESAAAQRLSKLGIDVVHVDIDDAAMLRVAFKGAHGVFSVQSTGPGDIEVRRGIAVADAAKDTGVQHFVYSSVGGADRKSGVPHFDSKWHIESHIRKIGLPATVVRPSFFMDNLLDFKTRLILLALLRSYLPESKSLQMVGAKDIGVVVAHMFSEPGTYVGKAMEIAGDELRYEEIVSALRSYRWYVGMPLILPRSILRLLPNDIARMFEWFADEGYRADILSVRAIHPGLMTFDRWLSNKTSPNTV